MQDLIATINEIVKYGLEPGLGKPYGYKHLEKNLVKIYSFYFDVRYEHDDTAYPDFDRKQFPNIIENVQSNFPKFGFYKTILDINDVAKNDDIAMGDAVDDLSDIILDLLELRWRIENCSTNNGLWYFDIRFPIHTQQHILDLLNYIKQQDENSLQGL